VNCLPGPCSHRCLFGASPPLLPRLRRAVQRPTGGWPQSFAKPVQPSSRRCVQPLCAAPLLLELAQPSRSSPATTTVAVFAASSRSSPKGSPPPPPPARHIGMRGTYFHHPTHPVTRRRLPHACAAALRPTAPLHRPPLHASMSSCCIFPHPYRYSRFGLCKSRRSHSRGFVQVASKSQSRICTSRVEITVDDLYKQSRTHSRCFASPSRQRCAAPLHKVERSAARERQCKPPGAGVRSSPGSSEHSIEVRITHVMYTTTYVEAITARIAPSRP